MSDKPTTVARFANVGADVLEPSSGKKDIGWVDAEEPAAEYMNWLFRTSYLWQQYLSDAAYQGQNTFRAASEDTFVPLVVGLDPSNGSRRSTIDHNGFRMGQVTEYHENWMTDGTTEPAGWLAPDVLGSATRAYSGPSSSVPFRRVTLTSGATDPSSIRIRTLELTYMDADRTFVMEGQVLVTSTTKGDFRWGLWNNGTGYGWWFRFRPQDNADIECFTVGAGGTVDEYDTNVAIAGSTLYRLRLEVCGANNHDGSNGLVRFFINGTLVREFNFSDPTLADTVEVMAYLANTDTTSVIAVCGPIRWAFNHRATPDNL